MNIILDLTHRVKDFELCTKTLVWPHLMTIILIVSPMGSGKGSREGRVLEREGRMCDLG